MSEEAGTSDLSLVSFDDLINELESRCSEFVFHGRKLLRVKEDGTPCHAYRRRQKGTYESTIFLAAQLQQELCQDLRDDWEDPEPWEEF